MPRKEVPNLASAREYIRRWLSENDISAAELSRISGLKQYTISRFLNGKVDEVDLATATSLFRAVGTGRPAAERVLLLQWLGLGNLWSALCDAEAPERIVRPGEVQSDPLERNTARAMVEKWMQTQQVSQAELARRAEIDPSRVGRFLRGKIEAKTAARIFRAVRASFDEDESHRLLHALELHGIATALLPLLKEVRGGG